MASRDTQMETLLDKVKANLILEHDADDALLKGYVDAAVSYAESYQHLAVGTYEAAIMPPTTEQAVISHVALTEPRRQHRRVLCRQRAVGQQV